MYAEGTNRYDVGTARKKIADGTITTADYLDACLDRIAEREPQIAAWTYLAHGAARARASAADRRQGSGMLNGIPVAIKDIIDTYDMPRNTARRSTKAQFQLPTPRAWRCCGAQAPSFSAKPSLPNLPR